MGLHLAQLSALQTHTNAFLTVSEADTVKVHFLQALPLPLPPRLAGLFITLARIPHWRRIS